MILIITPSIFQLSNYWFIFLLINYTIICDYCKALKNQFIINLFTRDNTRYFLQYDYMCMVSSNYMHASLCICICIFIDNVIICRMTDIILSVDHISIWELLDFHYQHFSGFIEREGKKLSLRREIIHVNIYVIM